MVFGVGMVEELEEAKSEARDGFAVTCSRKQWVSLIGVERWQEAEREGRAWSIDAEVMPQANDQRTDDT